MFLCEFNFVIYDHVSIEFPFDVVISHLQKHMWHVRIVLAHADSCET